jgi:hypothetical protein
VPANGPDQTDLQPGQVILRVDKFAFTSNNVTYAAFGDAMSYWNFFPAPDGWGRIPVWGFADVVRSEHESIKVGERFYGYYPMSSYLVVQLARPTESGFFDGAPHRQAMHPLYNQYLRTTMDPGYDAEREEELVLLRPLFITSFMIDDFLADNDFFGARTVVLSSASSKTAYGLAFLLAKRGRAQCEVVGLTSPSNVAFTESLGCYHRVVTYDQVASLAAEVRSDLHHHFGDNMKYSCAVGGTHWEQREGGTRLPGARPTLFFAPAQIKKRMADWGTTGLMERVATAWREFLGPVAGWMKVVRGRGPAAVERVYLEMLDGRSKPDEGNVLTVFE